MGHLSGDVGYYSSRWSNCKLGAFVFTFLCRTVYRLNFYNDFYNNASDTCNVEF